ncbi:MAG: hypothetical protein ACI9R3_002612 [Verrucomicrobiales bacterium]|jgi:hypothetical protein
MNEDFSKLTATMAPVEGESTFITTSSELGTACNLTSAHKGGIEIDVGNVADMIGTDVGSRRMDGVTPAAYGAQIIYPNPS